MSFLSLRNADPTAAARTPAQTAGTGPVPASDRASVGAHADTPAGRTDATPPRRRPRVPAPSASAARSGIPLRAALLALLGLAALAGCAPANVVAPAGAALPALLPAVAHAHERVGPRQGLASWYGPNFAGRPTANGEIFDPTRLTAAHRTLPFGTRVRVVNLETGREVTVRINDRGPFKPGRIIDLSRAAAAEIGLIGSGVAPVRLELIDAPGAVPLAMDPELRGYEIVSPHHRVGQLLLLRRVGGGASDEVMVRVVGNAAPAERAGGLLVSEELYALLGDSALLTGE